MKTSKNLVADIAILGLAVMLFAADANAQNELKTALVSGATAIYAVFGVLAALALLVFAVNMKFQFIREPLKNFVFTVGAIALGFAAPSLVAWIKTLFSGTSINSL